MNLPQALVTTLVTALLSGLFSGFVAFGLSEKRDRLTQRLDKIEQTMLAYSSWVNGSIEYYRRMFAFAGENMPADFDADSARMQRQTDVDQAQARALLHLYVRDGGDLEGAVGNALKPLIELWAAIGAARFEKRTDILEMAKKSTPLLIDLVKVQHSGLEVMAKQGRQIVDRPFLLRMPWK